MAKQRVAALHAVYVVDEFEPFYINADYVKQTVARRRQELGAFFAERGFIESAGELVILLIIPERPAQRFNPVPPPFYLTVYIVYIIWISDILSYFSQLYL